MNILPKDFTAQEKLVAEALDELGIRYAQQAEFGNYTVDFFSDSGIVFEADGVHGHFKKADEKRDDELLKNNEILDVVHITSVTKSKILEELKEYLWRE